MALPKMVTGARAIFRINQKPVAFATNVSYRLAIPHQAVTVLGRYSVARHEPIGTDVSVTCGVMRFTAVGHKGNSPQGANNGPRVFPRLQDIISSDELQIDVIDRATGETIVVVDRARMTERSGSLGARDLLSESWNFVGVVATDDDAGVQEESSSPGTTPPNTEAAQ